MFPKLNPGLRLPWYEDITHDSYNHIGDQIEIDLEKAMDDSYKLLREHRQAFQNAIRNLCETTLREGGMPPEELVTIFKAAQGEYLPERLSHLRDPLFAYLTQTYSRSHYDISPPRYKDRNNLNNPLPVWSAAMWDIFPGSDQGHRVLLSHHRALYHVPHTLGRCGGVFVTPPDFDKDFDPTRPAEENLVDLRMLMEEMEDADPYWRIPPRFKKDTTIGVAREVMQHYEGDGVATIEDDGGKVLAVISKTAVMGAENERQLVWDSRNENIPWASSRELTPSQAYDEMTGMSGGGAKDFLIRHLPGRSPEIMTKSLAKQADLMPPYMLNEKRKEGLGYVLYLGVSDPERTKQIVRLMMSGQLKGVRNKDRTLRPPGIMIDTSHAAMGSVEKLVRELREEFPDLFICAGAYNDPASLALVAEYLDAAKGPKGSGGVCETYNTGEEVPDFYAQSRLAILAHSLNLPLLGDGVGGEREEDLQRFKEMQMDDSSEFNIKMALPSLIGGQAGGFIVGRHTSANPLTEHRGRYGKWASGEGSARANERVMRMSSQSSSRDARVVYGEGVTDKFYPTRNPSHLAPALFLLTARMRAIYSAYFSHAVEKGMFAPGELMRYVQEHAVLLHKGS